MEKRKKVHAYHRHIQDDGIAAILWPDDFPSLHLHTHAQDCKEQSSTALQRRQS
jgi:hypothetical protein